MSLVCLASQKGAPGVTLTSLLVAAAWPSAPGRRKLLLEADPSGGSLALRYRLGLETSLITLAVAARAGLDDDKLAAHLQELPGGLPAIVAPDGPDQVQSALQASGATIATWMADRAEIDAIADLGRMTDTNLPLARAATAILMVARPEVEHLQPAARRMADLAEHGPRVGWILVGDRPHRPEEIQTTYGHSVVAVLPDDQRTARALTNGSMSARIMKSPLVRTATTVATDLAAWLHPEPVAGPDESATDLAEAVSDEVRPALVGGDQR